MSESMLGQVVEPPMDEGEIRVVKEPDGTTAMLFANPDGVGIVRIGLGKRRNAVILGKILMQVCNRDGEQIRRLLRPEAESSQ